MLIQKVHVPKIIISKVIDTNLESKVNPFQVDYNLLDLAVFTETNKQREKHGLTKLVACDDLRKLARFYSQEMVSHNFFAHEHKMNSQYKTLLDRMQRFKIRHNTVSENLADIPILNTPEGEYIVENNAGFTVFLNPSDKKRLESFTYSDLAIFVVQGWMNSPGHRKNILRPESTHLGCGSKVYFRVVSKDLRMPYIKCTQNFGG